MTIDGVSYQLAPPFMVMATQNRSSTRAPTRSPRPSSTASRCGSRSAIRRSPTRRACSRRTRPRRRSTRSSASRAPRRCSARSRRRRSVFVEASTATSSPSSGTRARTPALPRRQPHAGLAILRVAKARPGRRPRLRGADDVKSVAPTVLAHRLILSPEARASGMDGEELVRDVIERTPVPGLGPTCSPTGAAGSSPSEAGSTWPPGRSARTCSIRSRSARPRRAGRRALGSLPRGGR